MLGTQEVTINTFIDKHENNVFETKTHEDTHEDNDLIEIASTKTKKPTYSFDGPDFRTSKAKKEENEAIDLFQNTREVDILEQVYKNRIPTLRWWANKNKYLDNNSFDDVLGELTKIFVRAIYGYNYILEKKDKNGVVKKTKKQFNNYLYSALENSMCNLHNRKKAKKRCPIEMDSEDINYMSKILLSLNYSYSDGDSEYTLQEIIPDPRFGMDGKVIDSICFKEAISVLCCKDDPHYVKEVFIKLGEGNSLASILKEYKQVTGRMRITPNLAKRLKQRKCTRMVSDMICEKHSHKNFTLLNYEVKNKLLIYEIELAKTEESDFIVKKIRGLRKNRDSFLKKINNV